MRVRVFRGGSAKVRVLGVAAVLGLSVVVAGAPAAHATPGTPQVSTLDLSEPGHVSGTVTSAAPWVGVTTGAEAVVLPTSGGSMSFDLLTWGLGSANIQVFACNDPATTDCAPPVTVPFTATDVVPQVTWPSDVTIGAGQDPTVTISDPQGGGRIMLSWDLGYGAGNYYDVARNGTSPLYVSDGAGTAQVYRCDIDPNGPCTPFVPAQKIDLTVRRTTQATIEVDPTNAFNGTISTRQPTVKRQLWTATTDQLPYTFTWHLEQGGVPVAGTDSTATGNVSADGWIPFTVAADGLPDGSYSIKGTLTLHHPDFGNIVGETTGSETVVVDRTAPTFGTTSQTVTTIYPYVGAYGYSASVSFSLTNVVDGKYVEIHDQADQPIAKAAFTHASTSTIWKATWSGRSDLTHKIATAGIYTAHIMDSAGNLGAMVGTVNLSTKKPVTKTFTKTVQAAGSTVSSYVGKCSTLKRPVRGWTGSQGYYANTRCGTQTSAASEVHTIHQMKLPSAVAYQTIHVTTYGGSAASRPGSEGEVLYLATSNRRFYSQWIASAGVGNHVAPDVSASKYVWSDHYFVWAFATGFGNRYDVKNFTVVLKYVVLV